MSDTHLVPIGKPRPMLLSKKWAQDIGVSLCNEDGDGEPQCTVYGDTPHDVHERAMKFVKLLEAGKVILRKEQHDVSTRPQGR